MKQIYFIFLKCIIERSLMESKLRGVLSIDV